MLTSNNQRPTPNIEDDRVRLFNIGCWTLDVGCWTLNNLDSEFRPLSSAPSNPLGSLDAQQVQPLAQNLDHGAAQPDTTLTDPFGRFEKGHILVERAVGRG